MGAVDWFKGAKDLFKDASAYAMAVEQVDSLQTIIQLKEELNSQLLSQKTNLESQVESLRTELATMADTLAKAEQELGRLREREKYVLAASVAFKRGDKDGDHEQNPFCPNCHSYLSLVPKPNSHDSSLKCTSCGHSTIYNFSSAYQTLISRLPKS